MFRFFKRKQEKKAADNFALLANMLKEEQAASISEPWTLAKARLEGGAKDAGAGKGLRMYNAHLSRLQNQWINPLQSVNSGYGTAHASLFLYQPVNYYECYSLAQDPLFAKVFNVLSETPFAKGGELSNLSAEEKDRAEEAASRFDLWQHLRAAVRSNYVTGGCLLYMDFGLSGRELEEPLDLNRMDMKRFRGFRHIDPINCVAVQVNTVNPAAGDYMQPSIWYVIGLGAVHRSHFLKFEANIPELPMRPLTLYFGMPLTQLIKQDVANSNLASQGLANLMNRFRFTYLKADESSFTTENAKCFKDRLNFMSFVQDNFGVCPIKTTEDVMQLTTSLAGMAENVEEFYLLISAKTDIPYTELMGKSAEGMNATGSGDRRKWYDKCRSIQESVKNNLLFMYGIVAGVDSGKFVKFTDFTFNPLEEATEKELAENIKSYAEVASALVNLGAKQDEVFEWLKQFKQFNLDGLSFDTETEGLGGYEDITPQVMSEFQAANEWREEDHPRGKDGKFGQGGGDDEEVSFEAQLSQIIEKAKNAPNERQIITLGKASDRLVKEAEKKGFNISDFIHNLDVSGVRHAFLEHGNEKTESKRGQTAISYDDLKKVPEIISDYDNVEFPGKNKIGRDVIKYTKKFSDGTVYYVEEIRNGRRTLTIQTMYKSKSR